MLDHQGNIVEKLSKYIFYQWEKQIHTPVPDSLDGITRRCVIDMLSQKI